MSKRSNSPLIHGLPLLRAPLLLNDLITCIIAFIHGEAVFIAQGVFQTLSIFFSLLVIFRYFWIKNRLLKRQQATQLQDDDTSKRYVSLFLPFVDLGFALTFFILHIIGTLEISSFWRGGTDLMGAYVTFGAIIAWVFHLFIAVADFHLWFQYRQKDKPRCPHCNHIIGNVSLYGDSPHEGSLQQSDQPENRLEPRSRDAKIDFEALANEEGETEGDRLILTTAEE